MLRRSPIRFLVLLALAFSVHSLAGRPAHAQEGAAPSGVTKEGASLGFALHRMQDDFGLGLRLSSPAFWHWVRFTGAGGLAWYPHGLGSDGGSRWETMYYGSATVETGPPFLSTSVGAVRPYGFGGFIALFPPSAISTAQAAFGGLGGFGLEARFMNGKGGEGPVTYFFEIGGIGTSGIADKLASRETLASGFLVQAGLRVFP
jgi:hypothetical protein